MVNFSFKGQGTIEYLVSIGVVVVISLVVVGLLITQTGSAVNVSSSASRVSQVSGLISVSEAVVGVDGNGLVTLMNNSGGVLTITKLSVSGNDSNYSGVSLSQGDERVFSLDSVGSGCSCIGFEGQTKTCEVVVYAESEYGLEKQFPVSVLVNCVSNATATNPSVVVQPVSGDEELALLPLVSFVSPTPLDGNRTANTSIDVNVNITDAPDLNEFKFNWNDTNYSIYDNSLVLMMNFDNISTLDENSTNITDVSSNENNGTPTNGAVWNSSGKYNGAYQFDGINDYIITTQNMGITGSMDRTMSAWIYLLGSGSIRHPVLSWGNAGSLNYIGIEGDPQRLFFESGAATRCYPGTVDIPFDTWTHVAVTLNSDDIDTNVYLYVNGNLDTYCTTGLANTSDGTMTLGYIPAGPFYGPELIDEVRVYNRVLSADEIKQLYYSNFMKYDLNKWNFSSIPLDECPATGGTLTKVGEYCIHTFDSNGTFTVPSDLNVDVLVVAGGGSGAGQYHSSGGGAGGVVYAENYSVTESSEIIIGAGGIGPSVFSDPAEDGDNSSFGDLIAIGGGGGASYDVPGRNGGSGGGGGAYYMTSGLSTQTSPSGAIGYGNNGGQGTGPDEYSANNGGAGGGGGAGSVGSNGVVGVGAGAGGDGLPFDINGTIIYYAGGGGGASYGATAGTGGLGGGGNGSQASGEPSAATDGTPNTGGGGGGAERQATAKGGDGGDEGGRGGGGGGGAGTIGVTGTVTSGGNGGNGLTNSISGTTVTYAGGGGGGVWDCWGHPEYPAGTGGSGGGGDGTCNQNGEDGIPNSGGGGGGTGWYYGSESNGGAGGSGIVIVRYSKVS